MKAVILGAGIGKRLHPITLEFPKVMVPINGKPILQKIIEDLKSLGIKEIVVVVGYLHEQIENFFGDGSKFGVKMHYALQKEQLGTGHALLQAEPFFNPDEPDDLDFVLIYGDNWVGPESIKKVMSPRPGIGVYSCSRVDNPERFGVIKNDGKRIVSIIEKPKDPPSNLAVAGIFRLPVQIFKALHVIPKSERGEYELHHASNLLLSQGFPFEWVEISKWTDIGSKDDLERVSKNG